MSEVLIIRLVTGETLISSVEGEDATLLFLKKPISIFEQHDPGTGKVGIAMADYLPYADNHSVMKTAVCTMGVPKDQLANNYREAVGEIILPPSQIQLAS